MLSPANGWCPAAVHLRRRGRKRRQPEDLCFRESIEGVVAPTAVPVTKRVGLLLLLAIAVAVAVGSVVRNRCKAFVPRCSASIVPSGNSSLQECCCCCFCSGVWFHDRLVAIGRICPLVMEGIFVEEDDEDFDDPSY